MSDATVPNEPSLGFIDAEPAQPVAPSNDAPGGAPAADEAVSRSDNARRTAYHSRFVAVYIGLAVVAGIGVGVLVASLMRGDPAPTRTTAAQFKPSLTGELGAAELAASVERKYRLASGDELAAVVAARNTLQDGKGGFLRVRFQIVQPFDGTGDPDTKLVIADHAIQYSLCGFAASCEIPGAQSNERFVLLQRQGLELAVRTFQNDSTVDNIAVFLNPVASADKNWVGYTMVFDRKQLNRDEPTLLSRPFGETLPGDAKTITEGQLSQSEVRKIDKLTRDYTYRYRYKVIGGSDALMQLEPTRR
jgi:hypothetical protein